MAPQTRHTSFSHENMGCTSPEGLNIRLLRAPLQGLSPNSLTQSKRPMESGSQDALIGLPPPKRARKTSQPTFPIHIDPQLGSIASNQSVSTQDLREKDQNPAFWIEIPQLSLPQSTYPLLQLSQDIQEDTSTTSSP